MDDFNKFARAVSSVNITRSRFQRPSGHKTTFNAGELVPIFLDEVLPGDTVSMDTAAVARMSTPIHPVMDNAFLDIYYFFVPMRLVWDHAKEFFGENTTGPWESQTEYTIPQIRVASALPGHLIDHLGLPLVDDYYVNALPIRAYCLIWNEWFRDQNVSTPIPIDTGDSEYIFYDSFVNASWYTEATGTFLDPASRFFSSSSNSQLCLPVGKFHDYFTSALPEPQKGPAVTLPLGGYAELAAGRTYAIQSKDGFLNPAIQFSATNMPEGELFPMFTSGGEGGETVADVYEGVQPENPYALNELNLYADLNSTDAVTINTFRQALALQGLYELDARAGTRYREIIKSHFGVTSPDARQQVPEYLHGKRIPITMAQVLQTSSTDETSPQGNTAAYSLTQDVGNSFTYSATEHGYLIGLACVRTSQTYQQRIEKLWSRKRRFDFYWPVFANLGEQPVYNKEIFFGTNSGTNDGIPSSIEGLKIGEEVFGFQEAWADYRYKPSQVTGLFRSAVNQSLDAWHYSEEFTEQPTLSPQFIYQDKDVVSRTLAVQNQPQFIADFKFNATWVRPMPMYSIPALLGRM